MWSVLDNEISVFYLIPQNDFAIHDVTVLIITDQKCIVGYFSPCQLIGTLLMSKQGISGPLL